MIAILDYGMGNVGSIQNMLKKVGTFSEIAKTPGGLAGATALIIPGVGSFDHAMERIDVLGLRLALDEAALSRKIPILGICLGMQLMTRSSEEGTRPGLGWIEAETVRIRNAGALVRVPHMGWNRVDIRKPSPFFDESEFDEHRFYFVHSYAVHCDDQRDVLTTTHYGSLFVSAFWRANLIGVQFHPEKSHKFGESFFRRFVSFVTDNQA